MKTKLLLCLAVVALNLPAPGRGVRLWSNAELMKAADMVVIAMPVSTKTLDEFNLLGNSPFGSFHGFQGMETTFKVLDVFKGMPANDRIVLHYYREDYSPADCPGFIRFKDGATKQYLLYLVKDGPNRYAPVTGQIDPEFSVKSPTNLPVSIRFGFPERPPIADANPGVRHPVQVHVLVRLHAERNKDSIVIKTDESTVTNLMVGGNMVTGTSCEANIYHGDKLVTGTSSLQGGLADGGYDATFRRALYGIPKPGEKYTVVIKLTYFETDEPSQHFWSPQTGKDYKVLCEQKFKLDVE